MTSKISATNAARKFADLLNRVHYRGEEFLIEKGGKVFGCLVAYHPPEIHGLELKRLWDELPKPDPAYWNDVEDAIHRQPPLPPA